MSTSSGKPWVGFTCQFVSEFILFKKSNAAAHQYACQDPRAVDMRTVCMLPSVLLTWIFRCSKLNKPQTLRQTLVKWKTFFFFPPSAADRLHYGLLIFNSRTVYVQQSKGWLWFNRCKVRLSCVLFKIDFKRWQTQNAKKKKSSAPCSLFIRSPGWKQRTLFMSWWHWSHVSGQPFGWR